jgi:hypothetical protein
LRGKHPYLIGLHKASHLRLATIIHSIFIRSSATIKDLDLDLFEREYLRLAIALKSLRKHALEDKLKALRFLALMESRPCWGCWFLALEILHFIPGAYVQFLRIEGKSSSIPSEIKR